MRTNIAENKHGNKQEQVSVQHNIYICIISICIYNVKNMNYIYNLITFGECHWILPEY